VGTDKRERQKANRQLRLEEMAKAQQQQRFKRRGLLIGGGIAAAILLAFLFSLFGSDDDDGEAQSTTTPAVAADATDTTVPVSAAPASTVPSAATVPGVAITGETPCPPEDGSAERTITFEQPPPMCIDETKSYTAEIETNLGSMTVELDATKAPNTVNNFVVLARYHYFDGIVCHRAIPGFMVQCGDPEGTGSGGPGYVFDDELPDAGEYVVGSLAMANSGAGTNTNGSQFFIITGDQGVALDPDYSLFGQVTEGLDTTVKALDALGNPDPDADGVPPLGLIQIADVTITES
jgi:cyclophilin family peptidyl-prolyl cis-trans isomerase